MIAKAGRYKGASALMSTNFFRTFREIFDHVPKTEVAKQLGLNVNRFTPMIENPKLLKVGHVFEIAELFSCPPAKIFELIVTQIGPAPIRKKKNRKDGPEDGQ